MKLTTEKQLADQFELPVEKLRDLRQRQHWPHVRLSRFDIRFTDAQIADIVATRSVQVPNRTAGNTGLTERSARRSA